MEDICQHSGAKQSRVGAGPGRRSTLFWQVANDRTVLGEEQVLYELQFDT
jgi:hypothetical protein